MQWANIRKVLAGITCLLILLSVSGSANAQAEAKKDERPAVNAGRPTLTDPASLTAPGWLEMEFGIQRDLQNPLQLLTPVLLKLTSSNKRLEYRLYTDGYNRQSDGMGGILDGLGDSSVAAHYLLTAQGAKNWDTAVRTTVKIPTASGRRGIGSGKMDYGLLLLASRDLSPTFHVDANLGYSALGRNIVGGYDNQLFASLSSTIPLPHSRLGYTNELAYSTALPGVGGVLTTMHGLTYATHPWDVWDIAVNFGLTHDAPKYQILFGRTFFIGKVF